MDVSGQHDRVRYVLFREKFHQPLAGRRIAVPGIRPVAMLGQRRLVVVSHEGALREQVPAGLARGELSLCPSLLPTTQHSAVRVVELGALRLIDTMSARATQRGTGFRGAILTLIQQDYRRQVSKRARRVKPHRGSGRNGPAWEWHVFVVRLVRGGAAREK